MEKFPVPIERTALENVLEAIVLANLLAGIGAIVALSCFIYPLSLQSKGDEDKN